MSYSLKVFIAYSFLAVTLLCVFICGGAYIFSQSIPDKTSSLALSICFASLIGFSISWLFAMHALSIPSASKAFLQPQLIDETCSN